MTSWAMAATPALMPCQEHADPPEGTFQGFLHHCSAALLPHLDAASRHALRLASSGCRDILDTSTSSSRLAWDADAALASHKQHTAADAGPLSHPTPTLTFQQLLHGRAVHPLPPPPRRALPYARQLVWIDRQQQHLALPSIYQPPYLALPSTNQPLLEQQCVALPSINQHLPGQQHLALPSTNQQPPEQQHLALPSTKQQPANRPHFALPAESGASTGAPCRLEECTVDAALNLQFDFASLAQLQAASATLRQLSMGRTVPLHDEGEFVAQFEMHITTHLHAAVFKGSTSVADMKACTALAQGLAGQGPVAGADTAGNTAGSGGCSGNSSGVSGSGISGSGMSGSGMSGSGSGNSSGVSGSGRDSHHVGEAATLTTHAPAAAAPALLASLSLPRLEVLRLHLATCLRWPGSSNVLPSLLHATPALQELDLSQTDLRDREARFGLNLQVWAALVHHMHSGNMPDQPHHLHVPSLFAPIAAALAPLPLVRLNLSACGLDASVSLLPSLPHLRVLDLSWNSLDRQGAPLAALLQRLPSLLDLNLHSCCLRNEDVHAVGPALPSYLQRLVLSSAQRAVHIDSRAAPALADVLARMVKLQSLDLSNLWLYGPDAAIGHQVLLPLIAQLTGLSELLLCGTGIAPSCTHRISEAIANLTGLRRLHLCEFALLQPLSVPSLAAALSRLVHLTDLHVCQRRPQPGQWVEGVGQLLPALVPMTDLRRLGVGFRLQQWLLFSRAHPPVGSDLWPIVKARTVRRLERRLAELLGRQRFSQIVIDWGIDVVKCEAKEEKMRLESEARRQRVGADVGWGLEGGVGSVDDEEEEEGEEEGEEDEDEDDAAQSVSVELMPGWVGNDGG